MTGPPGRSNSIMPASVAVPPQLRAGAVEAGATGGGVAEFTSTVPVVDLAETRNSHVPRLPPNPEVKDRKEDSNWLLWAFVAIGVVHRFRLFRQ